MDGSRYSPAGSAIRPCVPAFGPGLVLAWLTATACVAVPFQFAAGENEPRKAAPQTLREFIDHSFDWYKITPAGMEDKPARASAVLRWSNNARGSEDGATLLFIHEGLPLAVACVYPWDGRLETDFECLSRHKIIARYEGAAVWSPQELGVRFTDLAGAPAPEMTRPARLRQMKALSERFSATMMGWKEDSTDREELRLLPKALFRYEPKSGEIIDGAVFGFVMGTDPEVLLQIETVKVGDQLKWQYGFSRRTSGQLEGRLDKTIVWQADRYPVQNDPRRSHFTRGVPIPPAILAAEAAKEAGK